MSNVNPAIPMIALNISGLNTQIKKHTEIVRLGK